MIVTIGGMQGAGKTRFSFMLVAALKEQGIPATFRAAWRPYLLKPLFALVSRIRRARAGTRARYEPGSPGQRGIGESKPSLARRALVWAVLIDWYSRWAILRLASVRRVTVLDWTTWEHLVPFEYTGDMPGYLRPLFTSFPQGQLACHISIPPEVALGRQGPERTGGIELYRFAASRYEDLLRKRPKLVLDGNGDMTDDVSRVSELISQRLGGKH